MATNYAPLDALAAPKRILLIKLGHHGDILLSTPVARVLKQRFPHCDIDYLVYRETAVMLSRNPDVSELFSLDRGRFGMKKLTNALSLYRQLRARHYDWVLHLSDQWPGAILAKWLASSEAVGFAYPKRQHRWWTCCFTRLAPVAPGNSLHAVEQNLSSLTTLGLTMVAAEKRCLMAFDHTDQQIARQQLLALGVHQPYILIHPASRWFFKCWEDQHFAELIQALADDGYPIVLTAAPVRQEIKLVDAILRNICSNRVHSLAGKLSLTALAAVIDGAQLFIGVDSAPMHMAAALGKNTVALFGPSKIHEWHPWMTRYLLINAADYGPAIDPDSIDTRTEERYLKAIPVAPVLAAVRQLLQEHSQQDGAHRKQPHQYLQ